MSGARAGEFFGMDYANDGRSKGCCVSLESYVSPHFALCQTGTRRNLMFYLFLVALFSQQSSKKCKGALEYFLIVVQAF